MAEWDIDLSEVNGLRQWYGKQPRLMRVASAMLLNEFAYGTRLAVITHLPAVMTIRNPRFVANRLRYTKTGTATPIDQQRSVMGSIAGDRFTGWKEQEKGTPTLRHRYATLAGRSGDQKKQIRPSVRLKPRNEVIDRDDYPTPHGGRTNIGGYFAMMLRLKEDRLFRVGKNLYKRSRKKIEFVQRLGTKVQPKRIHWLQQGRAIYFKKHPVQGTWNRVVDRLMKPPGKK